MTGSPDALLREMLREAELVLAQQLHVLDEVDDKSEQLLTLSVAVAGAGLALFAFVADRSRTALPGAFLFAWAGAFIIDLLAAASFLGAYVGVGSGKTRDIGPHPRWLAQKANDSTWLEIDHLVSLLANYPSYVENNRRIMAASRRATVSGLVLLFMSVFAYAAAAFYVLRGGIG
ncbi:MAG: hypothetical protein WDA16_07645 [Candidatus Thermoplasmatota archaeon]